MCEVIDILTKLEKKVILAVAELNENAYGVSVRKKVQEHTGKNLIYGRLYNILYKLIRKNFVFKMEGEPLEERGNRVKIYYCLTQEGEEILNLLSKPV